MSVQDVLDELDASRGAFYHYFDSKVALLEAVVERMVEAAIATLAPVVAERAVWRMPALADAPIMRAWAGLYEMTPDQMGIISKVPGMAGLHVVAGFSGHGFMHGPIAGRLMAELVADGRAQTVDIAPLDIERFKRGDTPVEVMTFV